MIGVRVVGGSQHDPCVNDQHGSADTETFGQHRLGVTSCPARRRSSETDETELAVPACARIGELTRQDLDKGNLDCDPAAVSFGAQPAHRFFGQLDCEDHARSVPAAHDTRTGVRVTLRRTTLRSLRRPTRPRPADRIHRHHTPPSARQPYQRIPPRRLNLAGHEHRSAAIGPDTARPHAAATTTNDRSKAGIEFPAPTPSGKPQAHPGPTCRRREPPRLPDPPL